MNTPKTHRPAEATHADEEYGMPPAEAMLAGALALMTGHAQACCADQRALMAHKTAEQLWLMSEHPAVSGGLREMARQLHARWVVPGAVGENARAAAVDGEPSRALWHTTPEVIQ